MGDYVADENEIDHVTYVNAFDEFGAIVASFTAIAARRLSPSYFADMSRREGSHVSGLLSLSLSLSFSLFSRCLVIV